jgi:hypothetical protein
MILILFALFWLWLELTYPGVAVVLFWVGFFLIAFEGRIRNVIEWLTGNRP